MIHENLYRVGPIVAAVSLAIVAASTAPPAFPFPGSTEYQSSECSVQNPPCSNNCFQGFVKVQCSLNGHNYLYSCEAFAGSGKDTLGITMVCLDVPGSSDNCTNGISDTNDCCGTTLDYFTCGCLQQGVNGGCASQDCACGGKSDGNQQYCTNKLACT